MFKISFATILAVLLTTGAVAPSPARAGSIRINGSTSVANGIVLPRKAEIEKTAGVTLVVTPNSSGAGVGDLFAGRADIAMISSDLDEILAKLTNLVEAYKVDKSQVRHFDLADAQVIFIVNEANPVRKLSTAQIKDIYTGKITDWKELGGPAAGITAWEESKHGAMRILFVHELFRGQDVNDVNNVAAEATEAPAVAAAVARDPTAIGFVSSTMPKVLLTRTAPIETDLRLVQHLTLVTMGEPGPDAARVIDTIKHLP
ncbi:MAG: substrate-binding domain-containing protein [Azospirillaceae bacterium]|nr:substrate-binding domain-containing protein [Azospirillaceae bacterium]